MDTKKFVNMTQEEFIAYAEEKGIELTDEQLDAVSGGAAWDDDSSNYETTCTSCGKIVIWPKSQPDPTHCPYCGHKFFFQE